MKKGSFVKIKNYQTNEVKGKTFVGSQCPSTRIQTNSQTNRIMVVLDCEVLSHLGERDKLGVPEQLEPKDGASAPTTGAPAAGAPQAASNPGPAVKSEDQKSQPNGIASRDFYGNKPAPPAQQKSVSSRPSMSGAQAGSIYPIEALSPYAHKWTIRARCTFKSDIKTWHKPNSEGKLFSVNLLDESGEIKATGFNEAVDQLYEVFQEGTVYYLSAPCRVQFAKKQFTNLNNDYELTFERDTVIEKVCGVV